MKDLKLFLTVFFSVFTVLLIIIGCSGVIDYPDIIDEYNLLEASYDCSCMELEKCVNNECDPDDFECKLLCTSFGTPTARVNYLSKQSCIEYCANDLYCLAKCIDIDNCTHIPSSNCPYEL